MKRHLHYALIPLFYLFIAMAGRAFTAEGVNGWYAAISKPWYTPPGSLIGTAWTAIYVLAAISFIRFVNRARGTGVFRPCVFLFVLNGAFNAAWSYVFFVVHMMGLAAINALLIWATVLLLVILLWPGSRLSSLLLMPYLLWVSFATYLNYDIYRMN
jgi:tryptophan-rich sensory protein